MCGYGKPPRLLLDRTKVRWAPAQTRPEFERQQQRTAAAMTSRRASKSQNVTPLVTPLATPPIEQKPGMTREIWKFEKKIFEKKFLFFCWNLMFPIIDFEYVFFWKK